MEDKYPLSDWMGDLLKYGPDPNISVHRLFLPMTHDSGAYHLAWNKPIPLSASKLFRASCLLGYLRGPARFIEGWTLTQDRSIYKQLLMGVRCFDLRIAYHPGDESFWLTHTFSLIPLSRFLLDVLKFLRNHPEEVIVVTAKPSWDRREWFDKRELNLTKKLNDAVLKICGSYLWSSDSLLSLSGLVRSGQRIVWLWGGPLHSRLAFGAPSAALLKPHWANTLSSLELSSSVALQISTGKSHMFNVLGFTLTPTADTVKNSICAKRKVDFRNLRDLGEAGKKVCVDTLDRWDDQGIGQGVVGFCVSTDFMDDEMAEKIVRMNF